MEVLDSEGEASDVLVLELVLAGDIGVMSSGAESPENLPLQPVNEIIIEKIIKNEINAFRFDFIVFNLFLCLSIMF